MVDLCLLNPTQCRNNGQCFTNITLNTTYCQCDSCHGGFICEQDILKQTQFNTTYIYFIIYIAELCFSVLNNSSALELFIRSRRIRRTNCGVYLIIYSILSLLATICLVIVNARNYYNQDESINNREEDNMLYCYVDEIGSNMFVYLCIWFSACVAFERGLVICFSSKINASRWRSFATTIVIFAIAVGSVTPFLLYKCKWDQIPNLQVARVVFVWFYVITGIIIYVLATLLILVSFTRRIRQYGAENDSFIKTFRKLLYTHLFILVPPISYTITYLPDTIAFQLRYLNHSDFQCGISTAEYVMKVFFEILRDIPFILTWLLFIYPSKVYMTEFYLNTWSGQRFAKILMVFKSHSNSTKSAQTLSTNLTNN